MKASILLTIIIMISACSAYKVQPDAMSNPLNKPLLPAQVKVVTDFPEGEGEQSLSEALVRQKLSSTVTTSDSQAANQYLLVLESNHTGECISEPILSVITLGILPTVGCKETGYRIDLKDSNEVQLATADSRRNVTSVIGIASWFLLLSPSWVAEKSILEYEANAIVRELSRSKNRFE